MYLGVFITLIIYIRIYLSWLWVTAFFLNIWTDIVFLFILAENTIIISNLFEFLNNLSMDIACILFFDVAFNIYMAWKIIEVIKWFFKLWSGTECCIYNLIIFYITLSLNFIFLINFLILLFVHFESKVFIVDFDFIKI